MVLPHVCHIKIGDRSWKVLASLGGALALSCGQIPAIAQTIVDDPVEPPASLATQYFEQLKQVPSTYEIGVRYLGEASPDWPEVTHRDTSLYNATNPSLWWTRDQLANRWRTASNSIIQIDNYRLIRGWNSFHSQTSDTFIIDIQVDPQYWDRLSYLQQYGILNQMGTTGMSYGYHVRVYRAVSLIGIHACDFSGVPELANGPRKEVPVTDLADVPCAAAIGPFIETAPTFEEDLFAPP
jgi:hypothetical protein